MWRNADLATKPKNATTVMGRDTMFIVGNVLTVTGLESCPKNSSSGDYSPHLVARRFISLAFFLVMW